MNARTLQAHIDFAASQGGGLVNPPGPWVLEAPILLRSNVCVELPPSGSSETPAVRYTGPADQAIFTHDQTKSLYRAGCVGRQSFIDTGSAGFVYDLGNVSFSEFGDVHIDADAEAEGPSDAAPNLIYCRLHDQQNQAVGIVAAFNRFLPVRAFGVKTVYDLSGDLITGNPTDSTFGDVWATVSGPGIILRQNVDSVKFGYVFLQFQNPGPDAAGLVLGDPATNVVEHAVYSISMDYLCCDRLAPDRPGISMEQNVNLVLVMQWLGGKLVDKGAYSCLIQCSDSSKGMSIYRANPGLPPNVSEKQKRRLSHLP